jgi:hypothetical protein
MKKLPTLLVGLALIAGVVLMSTKSSKAGYLTDIDGHPYEASIEYAQQNGIVSGYPDSTFRPNGQINRAEFIKIIVEANFADTEITGSNCFPDVQGDWYANYVCTAKQAGIITGYPDGTFRPANPINFVEAAKIIVNADSLGDGVVIKEDSNLWYAEYLRYLSGHRSVPSSITDFAQNITRAEMTEMIYRLQNYSQIIPPSWQQFTATGSNANLSLKTKPELTTYASDQDKIKFAYPKSWDYQLLSQTAESKNQLFYIPNSGKYRFTISIQPDTEIDFTDNIYGEFTFDNPIEIDGVTGYVNSYLAGKYHSDVISIEHEGNLYTINFSIPSSNQGYEDINEYRKVVESFRFIKPETASRSYDFKINQEGTACNPHSQENICDLGLSCFTDDDTNPVVYTSGVCLPRDLEKSAPLDPQVSPGGNQRIYLQKYLDGELNYYLRAEAVLENLQTGETQVLTSKTITHDTARDYQENDLQVNCIDGEVGVDFDLMEASWLDQYSVLVKKDYSSLECSVGTEEYWTWQIFSSYTGQPRVFNDWSEVYKDFGLDYLRVNNLLPIAKLTDYTYEGEYFNDIDNWTVEQSCESSDSEAVYLLARPCPICDLSLVTKYNPELDSYSETSEIEHSEVTNCSEMLDYFEG